MSAHGRIIWSELNSRDPEQARRFFAGTLGWSFDAMPIEGDRTYWVIKNGDDRVGGIFTLQGPQFEGVPEHWLTYIGVDDVDERLRLAEAAGATVMRPAWTISGIGRVALLRAPGGAVMAWMTPSSAEP